MKHPANTQLMQVLGYEFSHTPLLDQALTHPSASSPARPDNQRFEFLGDRVLGLVIAEALLRAYPAAAEGDLAPRLNELVRRETLADVATQIDLGAYLLLGRSETLSGGRRKAALLADAMEAVIAAIYLDGGLKAARQVIERHWSDRIEQVRATPMDAKTRIQEWAQARGMTTPAYRPLDRTGPDHAPVFTVEIRLDSGETATGRAKSKKMAEQDAAATLLREMGLDD